MKSEILILCFWDEPENFSPNTEPGDSDAGDLAVIPGKTHSDSRIGCGLERKSSKQPDLVANSCSIT